MCDGDEGETKRSYQQRSENTIQHMSKITEVNRERLANQMANEDDQTTWTVHPTYDALLIRYLPKLLPALDRHFN